MEMLQDPRLKKTSFLMAAIGQMIAILLIFIAFTHGVGWLIVVLQIWISLVFVLGIFPTPIDTKHVRNRLRWEQINVYPAINVFLYWIMSTDIMFSVAWFIGAMALQIKYEKSIKNIDYEYSMKKYKESLNPRCANNY